MKIETIMNGSQRKRRGRYTLKEYPKPFDKTSLSNNVLRSKHG